MASVRLLKRMTTEMGLTDEQALKRINENDLDNAKFIKANTDLDKHSVLEIKIPKLEVSQLLEKDLDHSIFDLVEKFALYCDERNIAFESIPGDLLIKAANDCLDEVNAVIIDNTFNH